MWGILRIFFQAKGTKPWTVLSCLVLASVAEGFGVASMLPLLSVAANGSGDNDSPATQMVTQVLDFLGLPADFLTLLLVVVSAIIVKALLNLFAMQYVGYAVADVATGMRTELLRHLLGVRWDYFIRQPGGRIANAVSNEATRSGQAYLMAANFLAYATQTVFYAVVAFLVSWKLALAALVAGSLIALALNFLVRISKKAGRRQTQRTAELVTYLSDALNNIKPLKAMAKHGAFAQLFDKKIASLRKALRRQVTSSEALKSLHEISMAIALGFGFFGAVMVWKVEIVELLVVSVVLIQTVNNIGRIQRQLQKAVNFEAPYKAVLKLIEETKQARERPSGGRAPSFEKECRLADVSFSFGSHKVLQHIDLTVPAGSLTVITGASGGGKTTLTDLLLGFYEPEKGEVLIDGVSLEEIDLEAWRHLIGYVPQELVLFHDTILANVSVGDPSIDEAKVRRALEQAGAWDFVASLPEGLQTPVGERGARLSGGQRQRIALARALAAAPKLLILDEVTSALDPETERDICNNLRNLSRDLTIIAITHRPLFLEVADAVYHLEDGRLTGGPVAHGEQARLGAQP